MILKWNNNDFFVFTAGIKRLSILIITKSIWRANQQHLFLSLEFRVLSQVRIATIQKCSFDSILLYCNIMYIATNSVFIYYTRHAKYFTYSCLSLLVHCVCLGLGLGTFCLAPITCLVLLVNGHSSGWGRANRPSVPEDGSPPTETDARLAIVTRLFTFDTTHRKAILRRKNATTFSLWETKTFRKREKMEFATAHQSPATKWVRFARGVAGGKKGLPKAVFAPKEGRNHKGTRQHGVWACRARRDASLGICRLATASVEVCRFPKKLEKGGVASNFGSFLRKNRVWVLR